MVIAVKGTLLFCLDHWIVEMLRIGSIFEYEYVGLHIQLFLVMRPDITVN